MSVEAGRAGPRLCFFALAFISSNMDSEEGRPGGNTYISDQHKIANNVSVQESTLYNTRLGHTRCSELDPNRSMW